MSRGRSAWLLAFGALACGAHGAPPGDGPLLDFRIAHTTPQTGFAAAEQEGRRVWLTPWSVLDDAGITSLVLEGRPPRISTIAVRVGSAVGYQIFR